MRAAGAVEELQQRPVAQRQRGAGRPGGLEDRLDVGQRQRLGQPLGRGRRLHPAGRVDRGQPVGERELVEPPHRHDGPGRRRRAQRRVVGVPLAQRDQEPGHGRLGDVVEVGHAEPVEVLEVAAQVAPVRRERVRGQAALDGEVVEVGADCPRDLRGGSRGGRCGLGAYASTSSGLTASMPDGLADRLVGQLAGVGVEPEGEAVVVAAGLLPALGGQRDGVRHGRVGQGVRRGVRHRARHVRHAVERRVVHRVGRLGVRGGVGVLEAAALVDRDVDQHRARLHPRRPGRW